MSLPRSFTSNVEIVVNQLMAAFGTLADYFEVKKKGFRVMIL